MKVERFVLSEHDWVPNNPKLPVLLYRCAVKVGNCDETAKAFETKFEANGWPPQWRDGIYDFHHYHSTAHEALGVAAGSATLTIGGPGGREIDVAAGDALILPTGTGHCSIKASEDFLVVGAYPQGQDWDICRKAPSGEARERMAALPIPGADPIEGQQER
ncbi:cupin domain-containing protein [Sphingomonas sp. QA11]|uniref:cupin domain-containing protein n=1 Tax=Sphingomonas sp. QA11 TaxID=2950605 RepID=UPI0023495714|nr:cupin domain-containing protein [Sphingomonas sp. QA11]WCM25901.1 cupin domain-containing protein [Sphingomonas sp. QA11]